jgi:MFS family permease
MTVQSSAPPRAGVVAGPHGSASLSPEETADAAGFETPVRGAWFSLVVLTGLYALSILDRQVLALLVQPIRADLGIDDFQIGLISGIAFALFYATFGLLFGWLADRTSRRAIVFAGVIVWSVSAAACGLARHFPALLASRFGLGAGEAALNPSAYSIISDSFPRKRLSFALSVFATGAVLGSAGSLLLGGALLALLPAAGMDLPMLGHLAPWRLVFVLIGLPGLALAFTVWLLRDPPRRQKLSQENTGLVDTLRFMRTRWRFFACHHLGFGTFIAIIYGWQAWSPTYLIRHFHMSITEIVALTAPINFVAGAGSTLACGWLADRLFARGHTTIHLVLPAILCAIQVGLTVLGVWTTSVSLYMVATFGVVLMTGTSGIAVAALQLVTPNNFRGQVSSTYLFCFNLLGMGVGPTLVGWLTSHVFADDAMVGWSTAAAAAILGPIAIILLLLGRAPMRAAIAGSAHWTGPA